MGGMIRKAKAAVIYPNHARMRCDCSKQYSDNEQKPYQEDDGKVVITAQYIKARIAVLAWTED